MEEIVGFAAGAVFLVSVFIVVVVLVCRSYRTWKSTNEETNLKNQPKLHIVFRKMSGSKKSNTETTVERSSKSGEEHGVVTAETSFSVSITKDDSISGHENKAMGEELNKNNNNANNSGANADDENLKVESPIRRSALAYSEINLNDGDA